MDLLRNFQLYTCKHIYPYSLPVIPLQLQRFFHRIYYLVVKDISIKRMFIWFLHRPYLYLFLRRNMNTSSSLRNMRMCLSFFSLGDYVILKPRLFVTRLARGRLLHFSQSRLLAPCSFLDSCYARFLPNKVIIILFLAFFVSKICYT